MLTRAPVCVPSPEASWVTSSAVPSEGTTTTVVAALQTDTAEVVAPEVEDADEGDGKGRDKDKAHAKNDGRGHGNAYGHFKKDD